MVGFHLNRVSPVSALWLAEAAVSQLASGAYKSRFSGCRCFAAGSEEKKWRKKTRRRRRGGRRRKRRRKRKRGRKEENIQLGAFCFSAGKRAKKKVWGEKSFLVEVWKCFTVHEDSQGGRQITVRIPCVLTLTRLWDTASVWTGWEDGGCPRGVSSPAERPAAYRAGTQSSDTPGCSCYCCCWWSTTTRTGTELESHLDV